MTLNTVNRIVFGIIATVIGLAFWVSAPKSVTVAGVTATYTSEWNATKNLILKRVRDNGGGNTVSDEIIIGVASWQVLGKFGDNGPFFKETWNSLNSTIRFETGRIIKIVPNDHSGGWIAGALFPTVGFTMDLLTVSSRERGDPVNSTQGTEAKAVGNTASCLENISGDCIYATGAYGFTNYYNWDGDSGNRSRTNGFAIPTRWVVSGTVCEASTDQACK
ncbi:MAG: hypothetical protein AAB774_01845 [Patescibacteria group bacterium]